MAVVVMVDGLPVTLDEKLWSWDSNVQPVAANSYLVRSKCDPIEMYRTQPAIRTVVGFLARNIAQVPLHSFELAANGDRKRTRGTELADLLKTPEKTATQFDLLQNMVTDVCLFDRWAALPTRSRSDVLSLRRIPPTMWRFTRDAIRRPTGILVWWEPGKKPQKYGLASLVWLDGYPIDGATPIDSLAGLLQEDIDAASYRRNLWAKGGRFPGVITRPEKAPPWTAKGADGKSARDRFRESWNEYAEAGDQAGGTPILEDGMTYSETKAITPEQAQQLETRKFSKAEVAAAFYLPPMFAGLMEATNYSNVVAFREILYGDTLGSWFKMIRQGLDARLVPQVDPDGVEFVDFAVAAKLRLAFEQQAKIFQTTTGGPIMTRNEARERLNLPKLDGADELIVPLNVTDGGQASPTDSGTQNEE